MNKTRILLLFLGLTFVVPAAASVHVENKKLLVTVTENGSILIRSWWISWGTARWVRVSFMNA